MLALPPHEEEANFLDLVGYESAEIAEETTARSNSITF